MEGVYVSQTVVVAEVIIWSGIVGALIVLVREIRARDLSVGSDEN
jgi:hypothetical protein